jgi:hypothetical protein
MTQEVSRRARAYSGTAVERIVVYHPFDVANVSDPRFMIQSDFLARSSRDEVHSFGEHWWSGLIGVWDDVSNGDSVAGHDKTFASLHPIEYVSVVISELSLSDESSHS